MSNHHRRCIPCDQNIKKNIPTFQCRQKNVLDIRIVPGDPHGAWVECYDNTYDEHAQIGKAEEYASEIHYKYERIRREREDRLRNFQTEVSRRVRCLEKLKRLQLQARKIKNEEDEQNAILQRTLGLKIPYKGTVEDLKVLNKELLKSCIVPSHDVKKYLEQQNQMKESTQILNATSEKISTETEKARDDLSTERIENLSDKDECLPGGRWTTNSQDHKSTHARQKIPIFNKPLDDVWTGQHQIKQHQFLNEDNENGGKDSDGDGDSNSGDGVDGVNEVVSELEEENANDNVEEKDIGRADTFSESLLADPLRELGINSFHKNLVLDWCDKQHKSTKDGKKQEKHQYWNYRKIFMEIEREQVQNYRRKQEHKKRILELKIAKENERASAQFFSEFPEVTFISKTDPSPNKDLDRSLSIKHDHAECDEEEESELYRYINALRAVAKERLKISNITLPPLCPCGPNIWDSHPETCLNYCIFYKNPKAYVRALTTILANNR